jgi:hypothetical protein
MVERIKMTIVLFKALHIQSNKKILWYVAINMKTTVRATLFLKESKFI